jgi:hypothetical protein
MQIRVREDNINKTLFKTLDDSVEWFAMSLGLCNAPATFQRMMNDIVRDFYAISL